MLSRKNDEQGPHDWGVGARRGTGMGKGARGGASGCWMVEETIVGLHPVMRALRVALAALARTTRAVAISGESGTGKDLCARTLHELGGGEMLLRIDCGDAPDVLEQRLVRWAADVDRRRVTLLLDGLPALPLDLQGQLSAWLAQRGPRQGRVVITLQDPLPVARHSGRLSAALWRQLAPVELPIPPLRDRRADIPVLAEHFLACYSARHERQPCGIEAPAVVRLWSYDWPGNVRELENAIERAVVLCRSGMVRPADLPPHMTGGSPVPPARSPRPVGPQLTSQTLRAQL